MKAIKSFSFLFLALALSLSSTAQDGSDPDNHLSIGEEMPDFNSSDYLLFGSFYGLNPALRPQITDLLVRAGKSGALIYYDPNFRSNHLASLDELRKIIEENFRASTIVRASDEDMKNIYGIESAEEDDCICEAHDHHQRR